MPIQKSEPRHPFSDRCIFIVGNARSGTSVFCDCLNLSPEIRLFQEANFFINYAREDFVQFFNDQHRTFGNSRGKGTYIAFTGCKENSWALLERLAAQYRYVGEKVAFGPKSMLNGRPYQDVFLDFHAEHFADSVYLLIVRRPSEAVWSMSKMWPSRGIGELLECWLLTLRICLELYRLFPKVYYLSWNSLSVNSIQRVARLLGVQMDVPPAILNEGRILSSLHGSELPPRLRPFRRLLLECEGLCNDLRDSFSTTDFRLCRPEGATWLLDEFAAHIDSVLDRLEQHPSGAPDGLNLDSGERLVPDQGEPLALAEHQSRYAFACRYASDKRVLDVGCGAGYGSDLLAGSGARDVLGIDPSPEAIEFAESRYSRPGLRYQVGCWPAVSFPDKSFDLVVMLEVLEHIEDADGCLAAARKVLTDGGLLILSTPNQAEHPGELFNRFHVREYCREELGALLKRHFHAVRLFRFGFGITGIAAATMRDLGRMAIESSCVQHEQPAEMPFFVAICATDEKLLPAEPGVLIPVIFDRHLVADCWSVSRVRTAAEAARELVILALSEPLAFRDRFQKSPPLIHRALADLLQRFINNGEFGCVERILRVLLAEEPDRAEWHYLYAYCLQYGDAGSAQQNQRSADALRHYDAASAAGFDDFWILLNRGLLLTGMKDFERALSDLECAVRLHPERQDARAALLQACVDCVRSLIEDSRFEAALAVLEQKPVEASAEWEYLTAYCLHHLHGRQHDSLDSYTRALEKGFDEFWVRLHRGSLLRQMRELDRAEIDLKRAAELQPSHEGACLQYEALRRLKGD